jgi:predicted esterase
LSAARTRVQFIHGLEGSPQGAKARFLAEHFEAHAPAMDTGDFAASVGEQARALRELRPDVLIGSSFGGAVALELIARGEFRGPSLLLAPAVRLLGSEPSLPGDMRVVIVHGLRDDVVDIEGSRRLARTGSPGLVRLDEVDDDHRLGSLLATGRLAELVREIASSSSEAG